MACAQALRMGHRRVAAGVFEQRCGERTHDWPVGVRTVRIQQKTWSKDDDPRLAAARLA